MLFKTGPQHATGDENDGVGGGEKRNLDIVKHGLLYAKTNSKSAAL